MNRIVTFKIPEEDLEKLDKIAMKLGMSRSELVRKGVEMIIKRYGHVIGLNIDRISNDGGLPVKVERIMIA